MGTFREAVEEMEQEEGRRLSNDEIRAFKDIWVKENPKATWKNPAATTKKSPLESYVNESYVEPSKKISALGKKIPDAARTIKDLFEGVIGIGPEDQANAEKYEQGVHRVGNWLSKAKHHLLGSDDVLEKESLMRSRTREHALNELNNLLTGEPTEEHLRPEYGGDEPYNETIDFNFPARSGSKANPVRLNPVPLDMPTNKEQGIERAPKEFRDVWLPTNSPEDELRTEEVIINVPRNR